MIAEILEAPTKSELWTQVQRGIVKSLAVETANVDLDEVVERIEKEELGVLVAKDGDTIFGVAVLSREDDWVDVPMLWSSGFESLNCLFEGIEAFARALEVKGVKWVTATDKGEIYAARRGYRRRLVEYVKEM